MPLLFSWQENRMTKIELFNEAYCLAFKQAISDEELRKKPSGLAIRLRDAVQALVKNSENPSFVAIEAVARLKS